MEEIGVPVCVHVYMCVCVWGGGCGESELGIELINLR